MQQSRYSRVLALLAGVASLALAGGAAAGAADRAPAALPGISVAAWDPARGGTVVWRGVAVVRESRFLRGARSPTLSPTGGAVAYVLHTRAGFDVYRTGVYGGFEEKLASVTGRRTTSLAYSPDGRQIAFSSANGIETVSVRGVRRTLPTAAAWRGSTYGGIAYSPDGALIAFSRTWGDGRAGTLRNELAVVRADGRGARSLVRNPRPFDAQYRPSFSPDGSRIAFAAADGSLAIVSVAGRAATRLTAAPARRGDWTDADPVFSRDGGWIAFTRSVRGGGSDVYVVRADGSELRRLTTTPPPAEPGTSRTGSSALGWSPDGTKVLAKRRERLATVALADGTSVELGHLGYDLSVGAALWNR